MAITRDKKKEILEKLEGIFAMPSVTFVNFHGLSVGDVSEMRKTLKSEGVKYTVAKKTLVKRVAGEKKLAGDMPDLPGEIAMVYPVEKDTTDVTATARGVYAFQKKFDGRVSIVGGIFDGAFLGSDAMLEIATIPSRDTLLGMFVNVINSPIQGLAVALGQIAAKRQ